MTDEELIARLRGDHPDYLTAAAADRIEALKADLKSVLDRESATYARHDAKVERLEAALREFSEQKTTGEIAVDEYADADFEGAYDTFIFKARATLKGDDHE